MVLDGGEDGYWFSDVVWFSCIGAFIGLIVGLIRDFFG
jgi:hypothetical protein